MTPVAAVAIALQHCRMESTKGYLGYAATYLGAMEAAEEMSLSVHNNREIGRKMQVNYALGNMSFWRGDEARRVKDVLKAYVSDKVGWTEEFVPKPKKGAK